MRREIELHFRRFDGNLIPISVLYLRLFSIATFQPAYLQSDNNIFTSILTHALSSPQRQKLMTKDSEQRCDLYT